MEESTVDTAGIQKDGTIGPQQDAIKAIFQINPAVAVSIVAIAVMMIIRGVTISYTLIISLAFLLLLAVLIYLHFDHKKKAIELERQRKDEAWTQMNSDRIELEKLINESKDQFLVEISSIENDWPVQTQSIDKLKSELNKLYQEIHELSLKMLSEASSHKRLIYLCKSGEWSHVMSFRKIQEDAIKKCTSRTSEISALKKKYKITDSAVLAETTRKTAEELGYLLPNENSGLKLYKLPLQVTKTHKKIRRFEFGEDKGKSHRYFKKNISYCCIVKFPCFFCLLVSLFFSLLYFVRIFMFIFSFFCFQGEEKIFCRGRNTFKKLTVY